MTFASVALRIVILSIALAHLSLLSVCGQEGAETLDFDYVPEAIAKEHKIESASEGDQAGSREAQEGLLSVMGMEVVRPGRETLVQEGLSGAVAVMRVREDSVGSLLGIKPGDMITRLGDHVVTDPEQLERLLEGDCRAGRTSSPMQLQRPSDKVSLLIDLALPMYDQRYTNGDGAYSLAVPQGWFLIPKRRKLIADDKFDSLFSPDTKILLILSREGIPLNNPFAELEEYKREKLAEVMSGLDVGSEPMIVAGAIGFRVFYRLRSKPVSISRIAFVHGGKRYVINVVTNGVEDTALPEEASVVIRSLTLSAE